MSQDVNCQHCGKLLAKDQGDHLEIMNGKKAVRIYMGAAVSIDCGRCGFTMDLPQENRKKVI